MNVERKWQGDEYVLSYFGKSKRAARKAYLSYMEEGFHPVVDAIVKNLCEIDLIQYVRISQEDIQASNEIKIKGRIKIPISTTCHPSAVRVHLILDFAPNAIQFFEITSAVKGYGEKMVQAVMTALPDDWEACVVMDYGEGFWDRMAKKYDRIEVL